MVRFMRVPDAVARWFVTKLGNSILLNVNYGFIEETEVYKGVMGIWYPIELESVTLADGLHDINALVEKATVLRYRGPCNEGYPLSDLRATQLVSYLNSFTIKYNEEKIMNEAPIMSNQLLKVANFGDLMAVRSLTGIMRLNEHHLNNKLSTFLRERTHTVVRLTDNDLVDLIKVLEDAGYLVEVRTNTERKKTCNAYKVVDGVVTVALVFLFDDNKLQYYGYSTTDLISELDHSETFFSKYLKEEPVVVNYVTGFNDDGAIVDHREIDLNRNVPDDCFYPFIEEGIDKLSKDFIASNSNLLLLVGPRGTGKTTLLREFTRRYKAGDIFQMCGDRVILHPAFDSYLASLPEKSLVIIEDADAILGKRTDDNTSLSMLLNELDGLANKGSKFVITTNLENLKSVDSAILRVGRCFATISFRNLSGTEANVVADKLGMDKQFSADISLAEVFNGLNQRTDSVGFSLR